MEVGLSKVATGFAMISEGINEIILRAQEESKSKAEGDSGKQVIEKGASKEDKSRSKEAVEGSKEFNKEPLEWRTDEEGEISRAQKEEASESSIGWEEKKASKERKPSKKKTAPKTALKSQPKPKLEQELKQEQEAAIIEDGQADNCNSPIEAKKITKEHEDIQNEQKDITKEHKVVTKEQLREVLSKKSQEGKTKQVKELLNKYGAAKLTDVNSEYYESVSREGELL